jgi:hypothetical protein
MIHEPKNPIPCATPLGDGYVWYIKSNGFLENDEVAIILVNGGEVKHFTTDQIRIWNNGTYKIKKDEKYRRADDSMY